MKDLMKLCLIVMGIAITQLTYARQNDETIEKLIEEASNNSQLEQIAHELFDVVGPRLVGTPQMQKANDWAIAKYQGWGIEARNEQWGEWKAWERGITHIDLLSPRVRTLEGTQLAWSPSTGKKGVKAEAIILPAVSSKEEFEEWLPNAKGKFVLISMPQPTGRPNDNWEEYATEASFKKMKADRIILRGEWRERVLSTGYNTRTLPVALEDAGAVGIITSRWSSGFGVNKIFSANTKKVPTLDLSLEDYGLVYRLAAYGDKPILEVNSQSKDLGKTPIYNTIGEIKGTEKPDEYVILSAHFDSWDAASGATDNGTGTIMMMEVMRVLKKIYPNPKRTILVGHWGSEEQGLNGSRAFIEDHPELLDKIHVVFNQDNGTGRVVNLSGQGFLHAYEYLGRWMEPVPRDIKNEIKTTFPGTPGGGGSDYASFIAAGIPAFSLSSTSWDYWNYTWHTNRDTYDKVVFDDVRSNVILAAIMAYMACEDDEMASREQSVLPINPRTGNQRTWPTPRKPTRKGRLDK